MLSIIPSIDRDKRYSLLAQRRRDSGVSVQSVTSNLSRFSHLSQGKLCITLEVDSMRYLKSSDEYDIKFSDSSIISLDVIKRQIRCKIKASKVKQIQEELDEDDLSSMLDDIDYDLDCKTDIDATPRYIHNIPSTKPIMQTILKNTNKKYISYIYTQRQNSGTRMDRNSTKEKR